MKAVSVSVQKVEASRSQVDLIGRPEEGVRAFPALSASIIIPVHNGQRTIGRCLETLSHQTTLPGDYEIIVVNDGSTDRTAEIARDYGVMVVSQTVRGGPAAARNTGAAWAQGEILLFIDADCEASPEWIEEMVRPFKDPTVCGVYGAYRSRQTDLVARFAQAEFDERYERLAQRENIDFMATHAAAIRRGVFEALGGFSSDLLGNEDVEMAYRLSRHGRRLVFAPKAVVYHEHPSTLLHYLRAKVSRGYWRTIAYARHPRKVLVDAYTPWWLKLQVAGLVVSTIVVVMTVLRLQFLPLLLLLAAGLLATTIPPTRFARRVHPEIVLLVPWLSLARSAALALGVLASLPSVAVDRLRKVVARRRSE